jgi:hypothetical protein
MVADIVLCEAVDELGLEPGMLVVAAVKATNVSVEIPRPADLQIGVDGPQQSITGTDQPGRTRRGQVSGVPIRPYKQQSARRSHQFGEQLPHLPVDVVADLSDGGQVEACGVWQVPVFVAFAGVDGGRRRRSPW